MSNIYKNYKLASGEEVIGKLTKNDLNTITIHRPMLIKVITMQNGFGETKDMMILRPWNISNELSYQIKREHIILESTPTEDIIEIYKQQIEKEDIITDLYNNLKNDPEKMEEYVKNMIESTLTEMPSIEEKDNEDISIEEDVQMNFIIPNSMFLAFLMNGIVSLDPESKENSTNELDFNIHEFLNKFPKNTRKEHKKRYKLDFDEYFKDWNPEP